MSEIQNAANLPGDDEILWRYIDVAKFMALLESQELFFCRLDKLQDKYEGHYSRSTIDYHLDLAKEVDPDKDMQNQILQAHLRELSETRQFTFVNCWHRNFSESLAMWKIYAG